jgi:hypothetical protein
VDTHIVYLLLFVKKILIIVSVIDKYILTFDIKLHFILQEIFINIPREALDRALRQLQSVRVQFASYKNSKFFRPNNSTSSSIIRKKQQVISAALSNITITNLTELLVYNFHNIYGNAKQICVYWNTESKLQFYT